MKSIRSLIALAVVAVALLAIPVTASAGRHEPAWQRALEIRSDALNRKYHLGRYAAIQQPGDRGFDWSAAFAGAAGTVAVLAAAGAVVLAVRSRRVPQPS
jgi:peptidoglycan/LPS O-acetylase OafA/YrhL